MKKFYVGVLASVTAFAWFAAVSVTSQPMAQSLPVAYRGGDFAKNHQPQVLGATTDVHSSLVLAPGFGTAPVIAPVISTTSLPSATPGQYYSATLSAVGGTAPLTWNTSAPPVISAALNLSSQSGSSVTYSGSLGNVPAGSYNIKVSVVDANGALAVKNLVLQIGTSSTNPIPSTVSPTINNITPSSAPVGTQVTITGTGFTSTGNMIVVNGMEWANVSESAANSTSLSFSVPSSVGAYCPVSSTGITACSQLQMLLNPGTYPITVVNANGTSNVVNFTVIAAPTSTTQLSASLDSSNPASFSVAAGAQNVDAMIFDISNTGSSPVTLSGFDIGTTVPSAISSLNLTNSGNQQSSVGTLSSFPNSGKGNVSYGTIPTTQIVNAGQTLKYAIWVNVPSSYSGSFYLQLAGLQIQNQSEQWTNLSNNLITVGSQQTTSGLVFNPTSLQLTAKSLDPNGATGTAQLVNNSSQPVTYWLSIDGIPTGFACAASSPVTGSVGTTNNGYITLNAGQSLQYTFYVDQPQQCRGGNTPALSAGTYNYSADLKDSLNNPLLALPITLTVQDGTQTGAVDPVGSNILANSGIYMIAKDGTKRPYTSAGGFLSYGFNNWSSLVNANSADLALPTGAYIAPSDGSLINDQGTVYLITNGQRAGFASPNVFNQLGYNWQNILPADTSFMTTAPVISTAAQVHLAGTLINQNGTIYLMAQNNGVLGKIGIPSPNVFSSWGYNWREIVKANSYDQAVSVIGVLNARQPGELSPSSVDFGAAQNTSPITITVNSAVSSPINIIPGTARQEIGSYVFNNSTASPISVNTIDVKLNNNSRHYLQNIYAIVNGVQYGTTVPSSGLSDSFAQFTGNTFIISANSSQILDIYADALTTMPAGSYSQLTSIDASVSANNTAYILPLVPGQDGQVGATAGSVGTIYVTNSASNLASQEVVMGSTGQTLGVYTFSAGTAENVNITKLTFTDNQSNGGQGDLTNFKLYLNGVQVSNSSTVIGEFGTGTTGTVTFNMSSPLVIPAGQTINLSLKADITAYPNANSGDLHALSLLPGAVLGIGANSNQSITNSSTATGTFTYVDKTSVTIAIDSSTPVAGTQKASQNSNVGIFDLINAANAANQQATFWPLTSRVAANVMTFSFNSNLPIVAGQGKIFAVYKSTDLTTPILKATFTPANSGGVWTGTLIFGHDAAGNPLANFVLSSSTPGLSSASISAANVVIIPTIINAGTTQSMTATFDTTGTAGSSHNFTLGIPSQSGNQAWTDGSSYIPTIGGLPISFETGQFTN